MNWKERRALVIFGLGLVVAIFGSLLSYNLALYGLVTEPQAVTGAIASGALGCLLVIAGVVSRPGDPERDGTDAEKSVGFVPRQDGNGERDDSD